MRWERHYRWRVLVVFFGVLIFGDPPPTHAESVDVVRFDSNWAGHMECGKTGFAKSVFFKIRRGEVIAIVGITPDAASTVSGSVATESGRSSNVGEISIFGAFSSLGQQRRISFSGKFDEQRIQLEGFRGRRQCVLSLNRVPLSEREVRQKEAEAKRLAEEERQRQEAEAQRLAEEERQRQEAEAKRLAEEQRWRQQAEAKHLAEEERKRQEAETKRLAEEERKRQEAETQRLAEEERQRQEAETKRLAEEERKRQEAEAQRLAEEERQRQEAETQRLAEEERQRQEAETKRLAEEERKRQEAEAQRLAEEERQRQAAEAKRLAEEERKRQEAETRRLAEEERQRQEAEAQRLAEEERKRQEAETKRLAEEERQRQDAEAQRLAEEERKRQEAEAAREAARLERERFEAYRNTAPTDALFEGHDDDLVFLFNQTGRAAHGIRNLEGEIVFDGGVAAVCRLFEMDPAPGFRDHAVAELEGRGISSFEDGFGTRPCAALSALSSDVVVFRRGAFTEQRPAAMEAFLAAIQGSDLSILHISDFAAYHAREQAEAAEATRIAEEVRAGTARGHGLLVLENGAIAFCAEETAERDAVERMIEGIGAPLPPGAGEGPVSVEFDSLDRSFINLKRRRCGFFFGDAAALKAIDDALTRDRQTARFHPVWITPEAPPEPAPPAVEEQPAATAEESTPTGEDPEIAFKSVLEKLAAQHYMEARAQCDSILEKHPDYGRCYNFIGFYYERIRLDFDKAFDYYTKAIELGFFKAYVNYGKLAIELARLRSEKGQTEEEASQSIIAAGLLIEGALKLRETDPDYDTSSMEFDLDVARRFLEPLAGAGNSQALDALRKYFPSTSP